VHMHMHTDVGSTQRKEVVEVAEVVKVAGSYRDDISGPSSCHSHDLGRDGHGLVPLDMPFSTTQQYSNMPNQIKTGTRNKKTKEYAIIENRNSQNKSEINNVGCWTRGLKSQ
jgi:hypothetical protein